MKNDISSCRSSCKTIRNKKLATVSDNFLSEVPSKLEYNVKRACTSLSIWVGINPGWYCPLKTGTGVEGGGIYLMDKFP